ncbi:MAG TPA: bifunctional (p)ppGpp synthetase/guanosine-3',5'-bis(diphosphate) 3'-pyrophosphohydrolase [Candidatus Polarisedimenticolia bacterium]|jgi:GTP pyrophosphokinase|nr:bifunctional (p)ppGpp synthetase/guanosine-3',5'-bis(diphosphate) 3'-pyrophosphohydrolase [Candidatus Polarisedimenticolia bacterium]
MIRFEDVQTQVQSYLKEADLGLLRRAYEFSAQEHKGQTRSSGEPYLIHPLAVAAILADLKLDLTCIVAGLLHDVLEDTLTTREILEERFGRDIAHVVEGLTKISRIRFNSREQQQAESFRKMMLAMVDDIRVVLVKLADRLHNMRTLEHLSARQQERIARETMEIYAPLAHRLGIGRIKNELEDLALKYLDPAGEEQLQRALEEKRPLTVDFIREIESTLRSELQRAGIACTITGRRKHLYSIYKKIKRQRIDVSEVYDYIAFRVLTGSIKDCYGALGIIHGLWRPVPGRIKDFIAMPKPNMYQSLHTSVISERGQPFEVQLRTHEMHRIAEEGIAAHWKYKEGSGGQEKDANIQWLRQIMEWQQELKDPAEFLRMVKVDLYPDEVYCFTPQGQVKSLPRGATPVDFAYSVHTEVGHHCAGARVNGKLQPLRTELKNGDIVEILTSPSHSPSPDWLAFVQTPRARTKIRQWLNAERRNRAVELGKTLTDREFKRFRFNLKPHVQEATKLREALLGMGFPSIEDFYAGVGYGKAVPKALVERLDPQAKPQETTAGAITQVVKRALGLSGKKVAVRGLDDALIILARCCNPIRGEPIVGYITRGRGVTVHSERCPNLEKLLYDPERRIEVVWEGADESRFDVRLTVFSEDRPGILARITQAIADAKSNIKHVEARTFEDRRGEITLLLDIRDVDHLQKIVERLKGIDGVYHVERQVA